MEILTYMLDDELYHRDSMGNGRDGSIRLHQDAYMYVAAPEATLRLDVPVAGGRYGWLQVVSGSVSFEGHSLNAGDGVAFSGGDIHALEVSPGRRLLIFDLN